MLRFLGVVFLIVGLVLCLTIIGAGIGVFFLLCGVLLLVFGGPRRVVIRHDRRRR